MSAVELLTRRMERRKREHARAWEHYTYGARRRWHPDVIRDFKHKADVAVARFDECRLILNRLKANGR